MTTATLPEIGALLKPAEVKALPVGTVLEFAPHDGDLEAFEGEAPRYIRDDSSTNPAGTVSAGKAFGCSWASENRDGSGAMRLVAYPDGVLVGEEPLADWERDLLAPVEPELPPIGSVLSPEEVAKLPVGTFLKSGLYGRTYMFVRDDSSTNRAKTLSHPSRSLNFSYSTDGMEVVRYPTEEEARIAELERQLAAQADAHALALTEKDDAHRQVMADFKREVGQVARAYAQRNDWCEEVNRALEEVGIAMPEPRVRGKVTVTYDFDLPVETDRELDGDFIRSSIDFTSIYFDGDLGGEYVEHGDVVIEFETYDQES